MSLMDALNGVASVLTVVGFCAPHCNVGRVRSARFAFSSSAPASAGLCLNDGRIVDLVSDVSPVCRQRLLHAQGTGRRASEK